MKINFLLLAALVCTGSVSFGAERTLSLVERTRLSARRLEAEKYRPDAVFQKETDCGGWPGDHPGRTILALALQEKALGEKAAYLDKIMLRVPAMLNARGYFGPVTNVIDEQQLSGNGWVLRGLCAYGRYAKRPVLDVKPIVTRLAENLFLPGVGRYAQYPLDPAARNAAKGGASGHACTELNGWRLSTDIGCVFIGLDGLIDAYQFTGDERLRPAIDELVALFLRFDPLAVKAQTHATLTGMRALLRLDAKKYAPKVESLFALYRKHGMTDRFENYNWFLRYDTWTEPCGIVDSMMVADGLYRLTGKAEYRTLARRILSALLAHQRENGGFGLQKTFPPGAAHAPVVFCHEADWCCTMRGGAGLAWALMNGYASFAPEG